MGLLQKCMGFKMDFVYTFSRAVKLVWFVNHQIFPGCGSLYCMLKLISGFSVSLWCACVCKCVYLCVHVQQQGAAQSNDSQESLKLQSSAVTKDYQQYQTSPCSRVDFMLRVKYTYRKLCFLVFSEASIALGSICVIYIRVQSNWCLLLCTHCGKIA